MQRGSLLIGWGNPLRQDDGIGWHLAHQLQAEAGHDRQVLAVQQLTPDLAGALAGCRRALFVDAQMAPAGTPAVRMQITPLPAAAGGGRPFSHHQTPQALLQLSAALYGCTPQASQLLLPVTQLGFDAQLSAEAERLLSPAIALARAWLEESGDA